MSATKTVTQAGWVYFDTFRARNDYPEHMHYRFVYGEKLDLGKDALPVCEATISFAIPADYDPRADQVAALKAEKAQLQANFARRVTEIERQISQLQALEHSA